MKNWLKKNLSLLIFAGFAIFFGYIYWLIPLGLAIVAIFLFSAKRWGDEISGSAKKAFVVFFVCGVFVGTVRFSYSAFLKNLQNEDISADLNRLKPETLKAPVEASTVDVLSEMNDSVQAAYRRKQLEYKKLGAWYSGRGVMDSAAICIDSVVSIHKQALASQSQYERLLRERSQAAETVGSSVDKGIPRLVPPAIGERRSYRVRKDSVTATDLPTDRGLSYRVVSQTGIFGFIKEGYRSPVVCNPTLYINGAGDGGRLEITGFREEPDEVVLERVM